MGHLGRREHASTKAQNVTQRHPAGATPAAGTSETAKAFPRVTSIDTAENPTTNPVASDVGTCIDAGPEVPRSFPRPAMLCPHGARDALIIKEGIMTTRSRGRSAGFQWLIRGIYVGIRRPGTIYGGAAFLLLAGLSPMLVTLPMRLHAMRTGTPPSVASLLWNMVVSALIGLLIVPLYAGYLQVIDATERGLPVRARDVFKPYLQGEALRLIGYGLVFVVISVATTALIVTATGGGIAGWYLQLLGAQASHQPPPALPEGFAIAMALFAVLGLFMIGLHAIGLGQIALGRRRVFGAIGDGMIGALKNGLPLLVFAVCLVLAWIVLAIMLGVLAFPLVLAGKLIGAWLVLAVAIPIYIAIILVMYAAMFGVLYHLWRDVCGDEVATDLPSASTS